MNCSFYMPTRIISGVHCISQNSALLCSFGKSALIITGGSGAKKSGALDDVINALDKHSITHHIFSEVEPNPSVETCYRAGSFARDIGADFIIGIGGGSALDASKTIAVYAKNPNMKPLEIFDCKFTEILPIIAVGTTTGTGSEVTANSVLTVTEEQVKRSFATADTFPKVAFCDPTYTYSLPIEFLTSTALDALCHAVESFFSPKGSVFSRSVAVNAAITIKQQLDLIHQGDFDQKTGREALLYASVMAGVAIAITGTSFPHPMGYNLTVFRDIPHGNACAYFLKSHLQGNVAAAPETGQYLLKQLGIKSAEEINDTILPLIDTTLTFTQDEIEMYVEKIKTARNFTNGAYVVPEDKIIEIYKDVLTVE